MFRSIYGSYVGAIPGVIFWLSPHIFNQQKYLVNVICSGSIAIPRHRPSMATPRHKALWLHGACRLRPYFRHQQLGLVLSTYEQMQRCQCFCELACVNSCYAGDVYCVHIHYWSSWSDSDPGRWDGQFWSTYPFYVMTWQRRGNRGFAGAEGAKCANCFLFSRLFHCVHSFL